MDTSFHREFWGNPARRFQPFVGNSGSEHRAEDIAALGGNLSVPALRGGRVAAHGQQSQVGYWFSIDAGNGRFDVYCHVFVGSRPAVGSVVNMGDVVTRMATHGEVTGTAWSGPHIHFVVSDHEAGATRNYNAYDPRPIISATLASQPTQPQPEPGAQSEEDDMPINIRRESTWVSYTLVPGYGITAHHNEHRFRLAAYVNTGQWPGTNLTPEQRRAAGERHLNDDNLRWLLIMHDMAWVAQDLNNRLPAPGQFRYCDKLQKIHDAAGT